MASRKISHSITVCTNDDSHINCFQTILDGARIKFESKAYLHWYQRYGCEEEDFQQCFATLQQIAENYKFITS